MNAVIDAIKGRRSVRSYKADPVPKDVIETLIDAGNWAPGSTTGKRGQPSHCFWSSKKAWEGRPRRFGKIGSLGTL